MGHGGMPGQQLLPLTFQPFLPGFEMVENIGQPTNNQKCCSRKRNTREKTHKTRTKSTLFNTTILRPKCYRGNFLHNYYYYYHNDYHLFLCVLPFDCSLRDVTGIIIILCVFFYLTYLQPWESLWDIGCFFQRSILCPWQFGFSW